MSMSAFHQTIEGTPMEIYYSKMDVYTPCSGKIDSQAPVERFLGVRLFALCSCLFIW